MAAQGQEKLTLWSKRFTGARGWHVVAERQCSADNADAWLQVFRQDEPTVAFCVSRAKPAVASLSSGDR